jgi:hypothetical protein
MNWIATYLGTINPSLAKLQGVPLAVFLLVACLTLFFLIGYALKGTQVWLQLRKALKGIQSLQDSSKKGPKKAQLDEFFTDEPLKHLWEEYAGTLHEVNRARAGAQSVNETRATVPAEAFFTRDVLVDSRMFDDFTRHLPGVLTGLGIIGTFAGLLGGLTTFDPTTSASAVAGLKPLMAGVRDAFVASGTAIGCAMVVVLISRFVLAYFYRLVEKLAHGIDGLYRTGAGEEYLARLVKASENNEASTAQLKDALVKDLTTMMTNLVDRQIQSQETSSRALGTQIGESITGALGEPMKEFGEAMKQTTKGNGEQVSNMLETLLTGFMSKLEDTFGSQMRGINEQMVKSMQAMGSVQESLQGLLENIKQTNEQATNHMSGKLEEAMKTAADNQKQLTDQMRQFVQEFRTLVTDEQQKSKRVMDDAVMKVLGEVAGAVEGLENVRKAAATEEKVRHKELADQTGSLVGGLTTHVDELLQAVTEQVAKTQQNVEALKEVSLQAISGMNQGALSMGSAAERFETAGRGVSGVFERSTKLTDQLAAAATVLQTTTGALQKAFEQYDTTRKTVDSQVAALNSLVEVARREAGVSKELMKSIEQSAATLKSLEASSRENLSQHLTQVNAALVKAFKDFGAQLDSAVENTIAKTDRHLSSGAGHLNTVVDELAKAALRMKRA